MLNNKIIHWLGISDNEVSSMTTPSIRLRYGSAKLMKDFDITIGYKINIKTNLLVFSKLTYKKNIEELMKKNLELATNLRNHGIKVVVDFTDNYLEVMKKIPNISEEYQKINLEEYIKTQEYYKELLEKTDAIIVSSKIMIQLVKNKYPQKKVIYVPDAIDVIDNISDYKDDAFIEEALWFGMPISFPYLLTCLSYIDGLINRPIKINALTGEIIKQALQANVIKIPKLKNIKIEIKKWSIESMGKNANKSKFILMPVDLKSSKINASSNRLITGFSLKRPIVATVIPSYEEYKNLFIDIDSKDCEDFFINCEWSEDKINLAKKISMNYSAEKISLEWSKAFNEVIG